MSLAQILSESPFLSLTANSRIRCSLTEHEMPARADIVQQYISSKAFKKAKEWYTYDYSKYLPHIVQDRTNKRMLHCKLTGQTLNKIPTEVEKHVTGKKFRRLLDELNGKKKTENPAGADDEELLDIWVPPEDADEDSKIEVKKLKRPKSTARIFIDDDVSVASDDLIGLEADDDDGIDGCENDLDDVEEDSGDELNEKIGLIAKHSKSSAIGSVDSRAEKSGQGKRLPQADGQRSKQSVTGDVKTSGKKRKVDIRNLDTSSSSAHSQREKVTKSNESTQKPKSGRKKLRTGN